MKIEAPAVVISAYKNIDFAGAFVDKKVAAVASLASYVGVDNAVYALNHVFLGNKVDDTRCAFGIVFR